MNVSKKWLIMHARERQLSLEDGEGARVIKIHRFCVSRSVDDQGELESERKKERRRREEEQEKNYCLEYKFRIKRCTTPDRLRCSRSPQREGYIYLLLNSRFFVS